MHSEVRELPLEQKVALTAGNDMWSTCASAQVGLDAVRMADGPMGVTGGRVDERDVALLTPCGLSLAASWDAELVGRVGEVIGDEALRMNVQAMLAPNLNLMRSPLAGRAFELFGEDPHLIAALGWAWAEGVQRKGVASVIKHVVCNDSETDRRNMNAVVADDVLRDVYFWPFEYAAKSGAWAMLTGYNKVNGVLCAEHGQVLQQWLKGDLGWDGLVMSDWFGTHDGVSSLNNGLDLEMPGPGRHMGSALLANGRMAEVESGRIDDAAQRLLTLSDRLKNRHRYQPAHQAQRLEVLEEAAAAGMVLLRNEGQILPFDAGTPGLLAVIGPNATAPCYQGGTFAKVALSDGIRTPLEAVSARMTGRTVRHAEGVPAEHRIPPLTQLPLFRSEGQPGIDVTYRRDGEEAVAAHEIRHASSLIWFKQMPGVGNLLALEGEGVVEVRTCFVAPRSGEYVFHLGGTGVVDLHVNGQRVGSFDGSVAEGDIMGKLMQAPHQVVTCQLEEGRTVELLATLRITRSLAHGLWLGCGVPAKEDLLEQAVALAAEADEVLLIVGETADAGLESVDRTTTQLPAAQAELIRRVCAVNSRTVVVLNVAHPIDTSCLQDAAAVLVAWYPGQEFGPALAGVLAGDREPGGRLPVTFARAESDYPVWSLTPTSDGDLDYHEGWWVGYRSFAARDLHPAFSFGYGLGYARFSQALVAVEGASVDRIEVRINVTNVSGRKGKEVVQLYLLEPSRREEPSRLSLKSFAVTHLEPGEQQDVQLFLGADAFSRWCSRQQARVLVSGGYELLIGHAVDDTVLRLSLQVSDQGGVSIR
ncbi:beta-glucosidase [Pseudomonas sp. LB-090624]|uniref:beta-glucosidase n=1 Tax=Pseudomonas sp. LB-090624 TaxID=2213079 RepID=UPI000D87EC12|nr:glycoside hydrolase family 3 C-terminal domain-containing protein [Pseudomonas sp. LB-090624]PYB78955.1 beta-glucosidase [Pseudomonas sp. LB-090624]